MIGTIARIALMRVLPKRLIPFLTAWEVFRLLRGRSNRANDPDSTPSRTPARR
jgi:hypothetical protein